MLFFGTSNRKVSYLTTIVTTFSYLLHAISTKHLRLNYNLESIPLIWVQPVKIKLEFYGGWRRQSSSRTTCFSISVYKHHCKSIIEEYPLKKFILKRSWTSFEDNVYILKKKNIKNDLKNGLAMAKHALCFKV